MTSKTKRVLLRAMIVNILVGIGLYQYLLMPNFMDITWGISFSLSIILLFETFYRDLEKKYLIGAFSSLIFLSWNFIAGVKNFWIYSVGMEYHSIVIRTTLIILLTVLIIFLKGKHKDLKIILGSILFFQIIGALWAVKNFSS